MRRGAAIALLLVAALGAGPAAAEDLAVIVHPDRSVTLSAAEVGRIYLRKRRFWTDGELIVPVNRDSGSEARRTFVRVVFGDDAPQLVFYWNQQYFRGVLPPATLASNEAVKRFVAEEPLAIGYIDAGEVDATVRMVLLLEDRRVWRTRVAALSTRGWLRKLFGLLGGSGVQVHPPN
ncbi:MAG: hypothetical protein QNK04_16920 [Myxococcota bacterium]|nr:hypothetical protein [Myxococcota bacterium]